MKRNSKTVARFIASVDLDRCLRVAQQREPTASPEPAASPASTTTHPHTWQRQSQTTRTSSAGTIQANNRANVSTWKNTTHKKTISSSLTLCGTSTDQAKMAPAAMGANVRDKATMDWPSPWAWPIIDTSTEFVMSAMIELNPNCTLRARRKQQMATKTQSQSESATNVRAGYCTCVTCV